MERELEGFRRQLERDLETGFLTPIKQTRETTPIEVRYEWVAKRICLRISYNDLARQKYQGNSYTEDSIKKSVNRVITEAGLRQGT